jgi:hypothetical protein
VLLTERHEQTIATEIDPRQDYPGEAFSPRVPHSGIDEK